MTWGHYAGGMDFNLCTLVCVMCIKLQSCAATLRNSPWQSVQATFPLHGPPVWRHPSCDCLPATGMYQRKLLDCSCLVICGVAVYVVLIDIWWQFLFLHFIFMLMSDPRWFIVHSNYSLHKNVWQCHWATGTNKMWILALNDLDVDGGVCK